MKIIQSPNKRDESIRVTKSVSDRFMVAHGEFTYLMDDFIETQNYVLDASAVELHADIITILGFLADGIIQTVTFSNL